MGKMGIDENEGAEETAMKAFVLMVTAADSANRYVDMVNQCIETKEKGDEDFDIEKMMRKFADEVSAGNESN